MLSESYKELCELLDDNESYISQAQKDQINKMNEIIEESIN
jgi:hypothetical protein